MPLNQSMHNEISGLSSQAIESWLSDLTAQVPEFSVLQPQPGHAGTAGYYHTLREICQQPLTWLDTSARVVGSLERFGRLWLSQVSQQSEALSSSPALAAHFMLGNAWG